MYQIGYRAVEKDTLSEIGIVKRYIRLNKRLPFADLRYKTELTDYIYYMTVHDGHKNTIKLSDKTSEFRTKKTISAKKRTGQLQEVHGFEK